MKKLILSLLIATSAFTAQALILYGVGNDATTASGTSVSGLPFENVATIYTDGKVAGSAMYLSNGYFMTANHVTMNEGSKFSFDGGDTLYSISSLYGPTQLEDADIKLFYSTESAIEDLKTLTISTSNLQLNSNVYMIGSGYGRSSTSTLEESSVPYGGTTTTNVRWGMNKISLEGTLGEDDDTLYYVTTASAGTLASGLGTDYVYEAQLTTYDSGGALFYSKIDTLTNQVTWYLAGMAVSVSSSDESINPATFGNTIQDSDLSIFLNLAQYAESINAIVSQTPVPEPSEYAAIIGVLSLIFVGISCKKKNP